MTHAANTAERASSADLLSAAVHRHRAFSLSGVLERTFTFAFQGMVYPQIWEDPRADMLALELTPESRILAIASGGCNVLSYLTANPAHITAVDLNATHIALLKLKIAAARHLPRATTFQRFFAGANDRRNVHVYDDLIAPHLDAATRDYWEGRDISGRRRITRFARNIYRYGLLGRFISTGHLLARALGADPRKIASARNPGEQAEIFDRDFAPLFNRRIVRWITSSPASLFGLGIPPAQFESLSEHGTRAMADVLHERCRRLATIAPLADNYFAWQAFARRYQDGGATPPYLETDTFADLRARVGRITVRHQNMIDVMAGMADASLDRYCLLDAQDWMDDATLTRLWREITRTARPGARVIFRTAGRDTILPGRVPADVLDRWTYEAERSAEIFSQDRSAIYGGFHLYVKAE